MPWWLLLLLLIVVWFLESVASAAAKSVAAKRRGAQGGTGSGTSLMPGLIVMPLLFLGIALAVDHFVNPWGTRVVGTLSAAMGVGFVMYIGWAAWYLKQPFRDASSG
jgi:hypothetical protein